MQQQQQTMNKWRGSVRKAMNSPVEEVWRLSADFLGLKRWLPDMEICQHVDGEANAVGCVRYCRGKEIRNFCNAKLWAKEKLLRMDVHNYSFTYSVIDGNLGMKGYVATFRLCHVGDGRGVVEWSFEAHPSEKFTKQQFVEMISSILEEMIQRLDEAATNLP